MSKTISHKGTFGGGYFVINKEAKENSFVDGEGFSVTCKGRKSLLIALTDLISRAETYIKVCSFIIDNKQIFELLKKQLAEKQLAVFILTAVDERNIKSDILNEDEIAEFSSLRHFEYIGELVKAGAHVRASSSAHAKFLIKDGNEALLMSANLTEPSLVSNQRNKEPNDESGIQIDDETEIKSLERIFDSIFQYGTEFKKFVNLSREIQLIDIKDIDISKTDFPQNDSLLQWTYENFQHSIYEKLNESISNGEKEILLSTYSIVGLQNLPELIENIQLFIQEKKGSVKIFCRAMNHRTDHVSACTQLSQIGVEIFGDMFNHSKGISVDNKTGMIFTANIDGYHGLKNGFEVGYSLNSSHKSFSKFNSFLNYQIESAPFVFKTSPNKNDVFEFYKLWYAEKEIKPAPFQTSFEIKYFGNTPFANEFENGISNYPIFYSVLKNTDTKEFQFEINGKAYQLREINSTTFEVKKENKGQDIFRGEKYLLFYNTINLTVI